MDRTSCSLSSRDPDAAKGDTVAIINADINKIPRSVSIGTSQDTQTGRERHHHSFGNIGQTLCRYSSYASYLPLVMLSVKMVDPTNSSVSNSGPAMLQ